MSRPVFEHLPEIAERVAAAQNLLLFLDFDGTLTPIVAHPDLAHLPPAMREALLRLAQREDLTMVIISGRSLEDVCARIGIEGVIYAGNHGMEISGPDLQFVEPQAAIAQKELQLLAKRLHSRVQHLTGVVVENKGLTASIHFRQTPSSMHNELARIIETVVAGDDQHFRLTTGKMVYEIRPRVNWHKGRAARWISEKVVGAGALPICVGDDVTDEDLFLALPESVSIKVGPVEKTAADFLLADTRAVYSFLDWLARAKTATRAKV